MCPEVRQELQQLLSALCDGELTDVQHARLDELLSADAGCRRLYLEYLDMHARLLVHPSLCGGDLPPDEEKVAPMPTAGTAPDPAGARSPVGARSGDRAPTGGDRPPAGQTRRRHIPQSVRYLVVAAGTLAASLLVQSYLWPPTGTDDPRSRPSANDQAEAPLPRYIATLSQSANSVWDGTGESLRNGSRLLPGTLRLQKGVARIRFDSGPELVVEGPAVLQLSAGGTAATVVQGKVVFRGDDTTAPFDLHTPSATLVHLGTEYAVAVGAEDEEVHVFDGEVQRRPKDAAASKPEHLKAGEARRYGRSPVSPGQPTALNPARFVRQLAPLGQPHLDRAAGLLAYEGFDYKDLETWRSDRANGGIGWATPWKVGLIRPLNPGDRNKRTLNVRSSLLRPGAVDPPVGGCFDYTGFTKFFRRLTVPVRLDTDGVYYLSYLFRRGGPSTDEVNAVAVLLWTDDEYKLFPDNKDDQRKRLNVGVRGWNDLFTQLQDVSCRTPLPIKYGETYLLVAKIVASRSNPDQVFMRVYGEEEPIEAEEPANWSVVGPPFQSDMVFDWLQLHINSRSRQQIDELRLGTTWLSVTAPWMPAADVPKGGTP